MDAAAKGEISAKSEGRPRSRLPRLRDLPVHLYTSSKDRRFNRARLNVVGSVGRVKRRFSVATVARHACHRILARAPAPRWPRAGRLARQARASPASRTGKRRRSSPPGDALVELKAGAGRSAGSADGSARRRRPPTRANPGRARSLPSLVGIQAEAVEAPRCRNLSGGFNRFP